MVPRCLFCHNHLAASGFSSCDFCGAGPRDQRMAMALEHVLQHAGPQQMILEVGPTRMAPALFVHSDLLGSSTYVAVDLHLAASACDLPKPHLALEMDVCDLDFGNNQFDVVICNNVLGFVDDYKRAVVELNRVLKPTGVAFLQNTIPLQKTAAVEMLRRTTHPFFTERDYDLLGTKWLFGRDYFNILRQGGWIPLRARFREMEFYLGFKSTQNAIFRALSPLHEVRVLPPPANSPVIETGTMPRGQWSE